MTVPSFAQGVSIVKIDCPMLGGARMLAIIGVLLLCAAPAGANTILTVRTTLDNDTGFDWARYVVKVYMDHSFTLSDALVNFPATSQPDWIATVPSPLSAYDSANNWWAAEVDYAAGTPIAVGGTLDFSYKLSFGGSARYCQELTPLPADHSPGVPEPSSVVLLVGGGVAGALGLLPRNWWRKNRR
jgi:hypothetical protein